MMLRQSVQSIPVKNQTIRTRSIPLSRLGSKMVALGGNKSLRVPGQVPAMLGAGHSGRRKHAVSFRPGPRFSASRD